MIAPRTGPHIRSHSIGGPACRMVRAPSPGTTTRAGRTPTSIGRADSDPLDGQRDSPPRTRAPTGIVRDRPRAAPAAARARGRRRPAAASRAGTTAAPCAAGRDRRTRRRRRSAIADASGTTAHHGVPSPSRPPTQPPPRPSGPAAAGRQPGRLRIARREDDSRRRRARPPDRPSSGDRRRCRRHGGRRHGHGAARPIVRAPRRWPAGSRRRGPAWLP